MAKENKSPFTILIVDDEDIIIKSLTRLLEKNYNIISALNGAKALEILNSKGIDVGVIISDQRMPEMSGVDFLKESIKIKPDAIRIILTGYTDLNDIVRAINEAKIYKFLIKPIDPSSFLLEIKRAVESYEKETRNSMAIAALTSKSEVLENKIKQLSAGGSDYFLSYEELKKSFVVTPNHYFDAIFESLQDMEDAKDFIRNKRKLLRLVKDGKNFINFSKDLSTEHKLTNDFWKLEDILTEALAILAEWKKRKYLKLTSNILPGIKIFGNKTLLRDIIFIHSIIYYAENFILGDTIYFNAESSEDNLYTLVLSSSKKIDWVKIEEMMLDAEMSADSASKNEDLYFLQKLLSVMKGSIVFFPPKDGKAGFIVISLRSGK